MATDKYSERIEIRLTPEEKLRVQINAKKTYLNQTDYIRKCLGLEYNEILEKAMRTVKGGK